MGVLIPVEEDDQEIPIPISALMPLSLLANSQNDDCTVSVSQYMDDGIEPPTPLVQSETLRESLG